MTNNTDKPMELRRKITVCSECLRACCWQGIIMCDYAQTASTKEMTVAKLKKLKLEDKHYWNLK